MDTEDPLLMQKPHLGGAAPEQIEKATRTISEAARPVVLAGNGVVRETPPWLMEISPESELLG